MIIIKKINEKLLRHPKSIGETYLQHLKHAFSFGISMLKGSLVCFIHGLFPFIFIDKGSKCINELHEKMIVKRNEL